MYEFLIFVQTEKAIFTDVIDKSIRKAVEQLIDPSPKHSQSADWGPVGGGSINRCYRVSSGSKSIFVKLNSASTYPGMFEAEAKGLELMREHSKFQIPEVLKIGEENNTAFLAIEFIDGGRPAKNYWEQFAQNLAEMHRHTESQFGLDHDNYIGSLRQRNDLRESWAAFYSEMRLEPQLRMAKDHGLADSALCRSFDQLFNRMESLFPEELPALVHGDLWSGNFMCTARGEATIYDPAVYYGHREMDLAMSKLFGGFDRTFYEHYQAAFQLEIHWEERIPLGQLYPLLVHVNLFGSGYLSQLKACLRPFV